MQKMMRKIWRKKKGFTLIELLIVIAIIGILAGIAIPNFLGARTRARVAKSFADMDAIAKAEEMYFVDNGEYTEQTSDLVNNQYLNASTVKDPWGNAYVIATSPDENKSSTMYLIVGMGPDQKPNEPHGDASAGGSNINDWSSSDRVRGPLGGPEGAHKGYGYTSADWYNPANGVNSDGDIGYGSG